ncbi:type I-E CRISPR-associated protein Cas5/CasD [Geobacter sp. AOG1]|uniref:type I-E CRISPR-associated protein Cas5/CasD n=1 Tax=Geobacter sp. AOG1 TaxID=1566346 RepID=UPI001CC57F7A|nr:type I-E CRISPR-associated protein Cas5/CasD [Geobacter sp. AOG1]GFE57226.1 type I-E CRISPR-associated protein Cas5/CasD [Geobacter sp. AOG1]
MADYLVFHLYGPMAAWGDVAVGEYRPSFAHPSKSAIIGLLAAALGIRRDEDAQQKSFAEACSYAVRVDAMGTLLRDYHTIQVPSSGTVRNPKTFHTRKAELADSDLNTILSSRDYRCDAVYTVAVTLRDDAPCSVKDLAEALRKPVFTLYLGRKSCPLAFPLSPLVITAESVKETMAKAHVPEELHDLIHEKPSLVYWEGEQGGYEREQVITRRDEPLSRKRWQFSERKENFATVLREEETPCTSA